MASLFGPTPFEIISAKGQEEQKMDMLRQQQIAQQGGEFGVFAPLYRAGLRLGDVGSRAVMGGLFPEAIDPSIRQAQAVQSVQQKYQGQNLSDPTVLKSIASDLFNAGAPDAGLRVLKTAQEIAPKETKANEIGKTPEGFQVYQDGNQQYYLKDGQRIPYYGTLRQENVPPTGIKQVEDIQKLRGRYLDEVKPQYEAFSLLNKTRSALEQYSGIGDEVAKRQFLKASGESGSGLSNKDVAAFANFGPLGQRLTGAINKFLEGTYTEAQRKELFSLIDAFQGQLEKEANQVQNQYRSFASGVPGVSKQDIEFVSPSLSSIYRTPSGLSAPSAQSTAQQPRELTTKTGNKARILPQAQ